MSRRGRDTVLKYIHVNMTLATVLDGHWNAPRRPGFWLLVLLCERFISAASDRTLR